MRGSATFVGRVLRPADSLLKTASQVCCVAGSLGIVGLMVLINWDVFGRALFGSPVKGAAEIVSTSILAIVYLQLPDCIRTNRMIQSDMLITTLRKRAPVLGRVLDNTFAVIGFLIMAFLCWYVLDEFRDAVDERLTIGVPGIFTFPLWPFYGLAALGVCLAVLETLRLVFVRPAAHPMEEDL